MDYPRAETTGENISDKDFLSVHVENKSITLTLTNIHDQTIYYDSQITFEKWNGSQWQKVHFSDTYIFVSMAYVLSPREERTHPFPFTSFANQPACGRYRVIKGYYFADKVRRETVTEFDIQQADTLCLVFPAIVKRGDLIEQKPILYSVINNTDDTYYWRSFFFRKEKQGWPVGKSQVSGRPGKRISVIKLIPTPKTVILKCTLTF